MWRYRPTELAKIDICKLGLFSQFSSIIHHHRVSMSRVFLFSVQGDVRISTDYKRSDRIFGDLAISVSHSREFTVEKKIKNRSNLYEGREWKRWQRFAIVKIILCLNSHISSANISSTLSTVSTDVNEWKIQTFPSAQFSIHDSESLPKSSTCFELDSRRKNKIFKKRFFRKLKKSAKINFTNSPCSSVVESHFTLKI